MNKGIQNSDSESDSESEADVVILKPKGRPVKVKTEIELKKEYNKLLKRQALTDGIVLKIDPLVKETPTVKPKKIVSQKTLDALALGRAKSKLVLAEKYRIQRENKQQITEDLIIKKANKMVELNDKHKQKMKKEFDYESDPSVNEEEDEEEPIIKKKKPIIKKKKVVVLSRAEEEEDTDEEEEIVYIKKKKPTAKVEPIIEMKPTVRYW